MFQLVHLHISWFQSFFVSTQLTIWWFLYDLILVVLFHGQVGHVTPLHRLDIVLDILIILTFEHWSEHVAFLLVRSVQMCHLRLFKCAVSLSIDKIFKSLVSENIFLVGNFSILINIVEDNTSGWLYLL